MWTIFESVVSFAILHPVAAVFLIVCAQIVAIVIAVEVLCRSILTRDIVLQHRMWRVAVTLAIAAIPLHLVNEYCGARIGIIKTPNVGFDVNSKGRREEILTSGSMPRAMNVIDDASVALDLQEPALHKEWKNAVDRHSSASEVVVPRSGRNSETSVNAVTWLVLIYLFGAGFWLGRIVYAYISLSRKTQKMPELDASIPANSPIPSRFVLISKPYKIRADVSAQSPYVFGWLHPIVVVPPGFQSWTDQERATVLAHELAHIERNDFVWSLLAKAMAAIYWPHPASWWILRRIVKTREQAADELAADRVGDPSNYARGLIQVVERFSRTQKEVTSSLAIRMSAFNDMQDRIQNILEAKVASKTSIQWIAKGCVSLAIGCMFLASIKFREVQAQDAGEQEIVKQTEVGEPEVTTVLGPRLVFTNERPGPDDNDLMKAVLNCTVESEVETSDALIFNYRGKVIDNNGNPVVGATVVLMEACFNTKLAMTPDRLAQLKEKPYARFPCVTARTLTDKDGSYEFTNVKPVPMRGNDPLMWEGAIVAAHQDHGLQWDRLSYSNIKIVNRVDLKLMPTTTISGVFQTPEGMPLADAVVSLQDVRSSNQNNYYENLSVAATKLQPMVVTDGSGRFTFHGLPVSTIAYVQCKHPAWGISGASFKTTELTPPVQWDRTSQLIVSPGTIVAEKEFIFRGRITGENGEPARGMTVFVSGGIGSTMSNENGDYTLAMSGKFASKTIADRKSKVSVFPGKDSPYLSTRVGLGVIGPGEEFCQTDIQVRKGVWVSGNIVNEMDRPADGISIFCLDAVGEDKARGFTDQQGKFGFYAPPEVNHLVFANGTIPYQLPSFGDVSTFSTQIAGSEQSLTFPLSWITREIDATNGQSIELETVHVKRTKPFEINIVGLDGSPAVDAKVVVEDIVDPGDYYFPASQTVATDAMGDANVIPHKLLTERGVVVTTYVSRDGVTHFRRTPLSRAQDGKLVVELAGQPVIRGKVLIDGLPLAGAEVEVKSAEWKVDSKGNRVFPPKTKRIMLATTGADGTYAVTVDAMDECMVSVVSVPGYARIGDLLSVSVLNKTESEWLLPDLNFQTKDGKVIRVTTK